MNRKRQLRSRGLGWLVAFVVFASGLVAFTPTASAAIGDLAYVECIRNSAVARNGCAQIKPGLKYPYKVVSSPDGKFVYVLSNVLTTYGRDPSSGALTWLRCLGSAETICSPSSGVGELSDMVISPDGLNAYIIASNQNRLFTFRRNADTGTLAYAGCVEDDSLNSGDCARVPGMKYPRRITLSDNGDRNLYVSSWFSHSIVWFRRSITDGGLAFAGCMGDSARPRIGNCGIAPGLTTPGPMKVSPNGASLVVGTVNTLITFDRSATNGGLTYRDCEGAEQNVVDNAGESPSNCTKVPGLDWVSDIDMSSDGTSVYAVAWRSEAITHFRRDTSTGSLTFDQCSRDVQKEAAGCEGVIYIAEPQALDLGPDNMTLHVTGYDSGSLSTFGRNGLDGRLTQRNCFLDAERTGLGCSKVQGLDGASALTVTPDGRSLYVGGFTDSTLVRFNRESHPQSGPDNVAPETVITAGPAARHKSRTATFEFHSTESGARLICSLDNEPFQYCTSPATRKRLSSGDHRFRVTSKDAFGNRDASPAVWRFRVVV